MTIDSRYTGVDSETDPIKQRADIQKQFDRVSGDLAESQNTVTRVIKDFVIQCITPVTSTFPLAIGNPGLREVHAVLLGKITDMTDPTAVLGGAISLFWESTSDNNICITNIYGLTANRRYKLSIVAIGTSSQSRKTTTRGDQHGR